MEGAGDEEERTVNFFKEARLEQKDDTSEDEDMEDIVEGEGQRRKKPKINAYEFFEEMRKIGLRPLGCDEVLKAHD